MYSTDKTIIEKLKKIKNESGHFPTPTELYESGMTELYVAMDKHGGVNKFRELFGDAKIKIPLSHWTDEAVLEDLKKIKNESGHFPTTRELNAIKRIDLSAAITRLGGTNKFRGLLGVKLLRVSYWTDEIIINELKKIISKIGHFPSNRDLNKLGRGDLRGALRNHGSPNRFRILLGEDIIIKFSPGHWTDETISKELKYVKNELGHFPTTTDLIKLGRLDLQAAIHRHGGINRFRELFGEDIKPRIYSGTSVPRGHWTDETILKELKVVISKTGHFPQTKELLALNRKNLLAAMDRHGGLKKFKKLYRAEG